MKAYVEEETLDGDEAVTCTTCAKRTKSTRKLSLYRVPDVLVIHLKRFSYNSWRRSKVSSTIEVPNGTDLDVGAYCCPVSDDLSVKSTAYSLFAVSHHTGSLSGGHYTAVCRTDPEGWFQFNDSQV